MQWEHRAEKHGECSDRAATERHVRDCPGLGAFENKLRQLLNTLEESLAESAHHTRLERVRDCPSLALELRSRYLPIIVSSYNVALQSHASDRDGRLQVRPFPLCQATRQRLARSRVTAVCPKPSSACGSSESSLGRKFESELRLSGLRSKQIGCRQRKAGQIWGGAD